MNRSALLLAAGAALALAACVSPLRPSITVYTKQGFAGAAQTLHGAYPDLRDVPGFEDEISSFEIHRGVWQLCRRPNYRECHIADRSMPDLGAWDLDNAISSLRPIDEHEYERRHDEHYDDERVYRDDDERYEHRRDEDRYERDEDDE